MPRYLQIFACAGLLIVQALGVLIYRTATLSAGLRVSGDEQADSLAVAVASAEALIGRKPERLRISEAVRKELHRSVADFAVPRGHGVPWISSEVGAVARAAGVSLDTVTHVDEPQRWHDSVSRWGRRFSALPVRLQGSSQPNDLARLLAELERSNPFATLKSLIMLEDPRKKDNIRFDLVVEWPMWADDATERWFMDALTEDG